MVMNKVKVASKTKWEPSNSLHMAPESGDFSNIHRSPLGLEASRIKHEKDKRVATIGPSSWEPATLQSVFDAGADVFRLNYSTVSQNKRQSCMKESVQWKQNNARPAYWQICQVQNSRLGEFDGVKLLNNGESIRLLCGKWNMMVKKFLSNMTDYLRT